jgi:hypothetical protein
MWRESTRSALDGSMRAARMEGRSAAMIVTRPPRLGKRTGRIELARA